MWSAAREGLPAACTCIFTDSVNQQHIELNSKSHTKKAYQQEGV